MARKSRRNKPNKSKIIDVEATPIEEVKDEAMDEVEQLTSDVEAEAESIEEVQEAGSDISEADVLKPSRKTSKITLAGMVGSAILGGGIALGGAGALNQAGMLQYIPFASGLIYGGDKQEAVDPRIEELQAKLSEVSKSVTDLSSNPAPADLSEEAIKRIEAIESSLNASGDTKAFDDLSAKVEEVSQNAKSANDGVSDALSKLSELSQKVISGTGGADEATIKSALAAETDGLSKEIEKINQAIEAISTANGEVTVNPELGNEISGLKNSLGEISEKITSLEEQVGRIDELGTQLSSVNEKIENEVLAPMADVQAAANTALAGQQVAKSVSARALSTAIEQGGAFSGELSAAEALVGENEIITALKPFAATGVMTPAQLEERFVPVYQSIISAEQQPDPEAGIFSKLVNNAKSIVKVRPAGPQAGDDALSIASRISDKLLRGELADAKSEWEKLPEGSKSLSTEWVKNLDNRLVAEGLVLKLISTLTSGNKG